MFKRKFHKDDSHVFVIQHQDSFGLIRNKSSVSIDQSLEFISEDFQNHGRTLHSTISPSRLKIGSILFFFVFFLFLARSLYLQVYQGTHFHLLADENRYHTTRIVSPRGQILDRNGTVLAENIPAFVLTMTIANLPKDETSRAEVFKNIVKIVGIQQTDLDLLLTAYAKRPSEHIPVVQNITYESAMRLAIEIKKYPGFDLITSTQRQYPSAVLSLSHILGYTGKITPKEFDSLEDKGYRPIDTIGKTGVEKSAESLLRGTPGTEVGEVDASGNELSLVSKTDPIPGAQVILGIDLQFQKYIESDMETILKKVGAKKAALVAIDPNTGIIRALVSLPAYDNNLFASGISTEQYNQLLNDPDQPLYSRAISGQYPSGSIFKPFVAYAALYEHVVDEHTSFLSTGGLHVGDWFFPDWKAGGHGITDVRKAIADSINTFFYIVGGGYQQTIGLGVDRIVAYAKMFGFGTKTGIDLPNEASGFLPSKEWKLQVKGERWYVGDTYHLAIGQGDLLVTPLQMAVTTSIFANGGYIIKPRVIQAVEGTGAVDLSSDDKVQIKNFNADDVRIVREGMRQSVLSGSSKHLLDLSVSAAGKTGTAQFGANGQTHSWFTGFAPYENPSLVLTVLVEGGGESTSAAVPIANDVLKWWFAHGGK